MSKLEMAIQLADRHYRYGPHPCVLESAWQELRRLMRLSKAEVRQLWVDFCKE